VGQERPVVDVDIPPNQARVFTSKHMHFDGRRPKTPTGFIVEDSLCIVVLEEVDLTVVVSKGLVAVG
jgi:hypothetical protein